MKAHAAAGRHGGPGGDGSGAGRADVRGAPPSARNGAADILVSVEGTPVKTMTDLRNVLNAQKPGAIVSLRVLTVARGAAPQQRLERVQLNDTP